jgi:hypothetical protein
LYEVHSDTGVCTCPMGESGAFCKHQALIVKEFKISLPSSPPLLSADRHQLAKLATGNDCLPAAFFAARTEVGEQFSPVDLPAGGHFKP